MAAFLRLTAEAYLLADPDEGSPRQRWRWLLGLHEAVRQEAAARGLADVQAFLPPRVARAFGRRLAALGWRRDPWTCYTRVLAPVSGVRWTPPESEHRTARAQEVLAARAQE